MLWFQALLSFSLCSLWPSRTASSCWPRCGTMASRAGGDDTGRSNWSPASSSASCFLSSHWYGGRKWECKSRVSYVEVKEERWNKGRKRLEDEEGRCTGKEVIEERKERSQKRKDKRDDKTKGEENKERKE